MEIGVVLIVVVFAITCCALALWAVKGEQRQCTCSKVDPLAGLSADAKRLLGIR